MNDREKYYDEYENSIFAKLNGGFDKFVKKIGGKKPAIILLLAVFAVIISALALLLYTNQRRLNFDGSTFRLVSISRSLDRNMLLRDGDGNGLLFTVSRSAGFFGDVFTVTYLDATFSIARGFPNRYYTFSDGSRHTASEFGFVQPFQQANARLTDLQQAEIAALAALINFYESYTGADVFVLVVLGSLLVWLLCLVWSFYREDFHEFSKPFKRVWQAELEDMLLSNLNGKVSVALLITSFVTIVVLAVVLMLFG